MAALADDTALEIDGLNGFPGIKTARFAESCGGYTAAICWLLGRLATTPDPERTARFRTVAIASFPSGHEVSAEATLEGKIVCAPSGEGGFGFDSIFAPVDASGRTLAELEDADLDRLSHRRRAFRSLLEQLPEG